MMYSRDYRPPILLAMIVILASNALAPTAGGSSTQRYAIICGISDYESIMDLELTDDDSTAMEAVLRELHWDTLNLLLNQNASKEGIKQAIQDLVGVVDEDDVVLFYFAGHGTYNVDLEPLDELFRR